MLKQDSMCTHWHTLLLIVLAKTLSLASPLKNRLKIHRKEKPFNCDIFGLAFTQASSVQCHLRTHKRESLSCRFIVCFYGKPYSQITINFPVQ